MPQENLEIVQRANAAGNRKDCDELLGLVDPEIEWRDQMHAPDVPEVLHGISEVMTLIPQWEAAYEALTAEVLEYIDADPWVICITRWPASGRGSGMPIDVRSVDAYLVSDGKIVRSFGGYPHLTSARAAIEGTE
jgi:ketosteroid isomerase-like protein